MDDKGEVKCIKFSIGNKILAVQRTLKSVVSGFAHRGRECFLFRGDRPIRAQNESLKMKVSLELWLPNNHI